MRAGDGPSDELPTMPKDYEYRFVTRITGQPDETGAILFRRRITQFHEQRRFAPSDLGEWALETLLGTGARVLPPRFWPGLCMASSLPRSLSRFRSDLPGFQSGLELICGPVGQAEARRLYFRHRARLAERKLTVFREAIRPDPVTFELHGAEHLTASLSRGKGALLWATDTMFRSVVEKRGLWEAGFRPAQLSHRIHGFSYTRFGIERLNPRVVAAENRFLSERIVFSWNSSAQAVERALEVLRSGQAVIFTNNITAGTNFFELPLAEGGFVTMSGGVPSLSQKFGIPVHTVSTLEIEPFSRYAIFISSDISNADGEEDPMTARARIAARARDEIVPLIRRAPDQFLQWGMISAESRFPGETWFTADRSILKKA